VYSSANVRFHLAIARAGHNGVLRDSLRHLLRQLREFRERTIREIPQIPRRDIAEHRAIVGAIRHRHPAQARRAMIRHIRRYAAMVKRFGGPAVDGAGRSLPPERAPRRGRPAGAGVVR
jgi:GntR family transcriptional repressor for pyruvate dehydrogenase complex